MLITRLKIKISEKTDQQNADNVLPLKLDYRPVYSNIKANITTFELLNTNVQCCTYVGRRLHMRVWWPLNTSEKIGCILIGSRIWNCSTSWVPDFYRHYTSWVPNFYKYYTGTWIFFGKYYIIKTFSFPF
jgi:hypothetical protein